MKKLAYKLLKYCVFVNLAIIMVQNVKGCVWCRVGFSISHHFWSSYRPPWLGHKKAPLPLVIGVTGPLNLKYCSLSQTSYLGKSHFPAHVYAPVSAPAKGPLT